MYLVVGRLTLITFLPISTLFNMLRFHETWYSERVPCIRVEDMNLNPCTKHA